MPSQVKTVGLLASKPLAVSASFSGVTARSAATYAGRGYCTSRTVDIRTSATLVSLVTSVTLPHLP